VRKPEFNFQYRKKEKEVLKFQRVKDNCQEAARRSKKTPVLPPVSPAGVSKGQRCGDFWEQQVSVRARRCWGM
jgi:hypothetical protein